MTHYDVKKICERAPETHLVHESALAISVGINLRVKLVHDARLLIPRDGVASVGVVSVSARAILAKGIRKVVLLGVSAAVLGKVIVLVTVVVASGGSNTTLAATVGLGTSKT